jgi:hypothetical protein
MVLPQSLTIVKPHRRYHNNHHQPLQHNTLTTLSSLRLRISRALVPISSKLRPKREERTASESSENLLPAEGAAVTPKPARAK